MSKQEQRHRGAHPEDRAQFSDGLLVPLRTAVYELSWLLSCDYVMHSALELIGNHHNLTQRQRMVVSRAACSDRSKKMRKAKFVRIDDPKKEVDLSKLTSNYISGNNEFSPLLVTPNMNIELSSFSETYLQLMNLPDISEFAIEFSKVADNLYIAQGYNEETVVNNMILQLLLMNGYILTIDLTRGSIIEKVNRETIAAAKFAALEILKNIKTS